MKLIIREYLALLKESKELDKLLPELLLMMGIEPISHPQVGVRQFGVDVAAVGQYDNQDSDSQNHNDKSLLLFTIKQGDIGRSDWFSNEQSIQPSLDEIINVYLHSHIRAEHRDLKKKIILCTGGDLKQELDQNWSAYTRRNTIKDELEFEFWGGDKLAILIEQYMFNEQVVPIKLRSSFRKVLALLSDSDYDLSDYYHLLNQLLLQANFGDFTKQSAVNKAKKALRTTHLLINIIFAWSKNQQNLKPAILAAERTLLITWEFLRKHELFSKKSLNDIFHEIEKTFIDIYFAYYNKVEAHCDLEQGLHGYGNHAIVENLNIFEQLGFVSITGLLAFDNWLITKQKDEFETKEKVAKTLKALINNHKATLSPCYDNHIIEISTALFLLSCLKETEFIEQWLSEMLQHIGVAYFHLGKYFPIESDSFDDLISLNITGTIEKERLMRMSTLIPILAQWCCVLNLKGPYSQVVDFVKKIFKNTTLQIWYPDADTDKYLYTSNAAYESGYSEAPITIPTDINEMQKMIDEVQSRTITAAEISANKYCPILTFVASRHYRTPILPFYWQNGFAEAD